MRSRNPGEVEAEIGVESGDPVIALFEKRDKKHKYYAKPLASFSEFASHTGIYRRSHIPSWLLGRLFDEKVAKISLYSYPYAGLNIEVEVYPLLFGNQPVSKEEIKQAELHGLKRLEQTLDSEAEEFMPFLDEKLKNN